MSGNGVFGIGSSALLAYQRAMQVTGHNIANVATEGYSRQRVELASMSPSGSGAAMAGSGVSATSVNRIVDSFVETWLTMNASAAAYERTTAQFAAQLDGVLADPMSGLTPALSGFFAAVSEVASDPTSTAARQHLISQGQSLVDRFAQLDRRMDEQRAMVNGAISGTVEEINELADGIAELNRRIVDARGRGGGLADLLDKRDQLVRDLSERVAIRTTEQSDGSLNVTIGQGQALVTGTSATRLLTRSGAPGDGAVDIGFRNGGTFVSVTGALQGGRLGALIALGPELLDPAANALGRVAVALTENFNELHAAGMDLRNQPGGQFFARAEPRIVGHEANAATGLPALAITDVAALEVSGYDMHFDGAEWQIRRLADRTLVASVAPGDSADFDGLSLDLAGVTSAATGDRFRLQPLRVAGSLSVAISDPRAVAAALPVQASVDAANAGDARVDSLRVVDAGNAMLREPVTITFSGGAFVVDGTSVTPDPSGATTIAVNGWTLVIAGQPQEGDRFHVGDNAGGYGDNRAALALADLAGERVLSGGMATLADGYAELVADVGVRTRRAQVNADVQEKLLHDARAHRDSVSGVNLDEEAANLIRYQQAYQAAAQVIAVAGTLFDTLLAAVRR